MLGRHKPPHPGIVIAHPGGTARARFLPAPDSHHGGYWWVPRLLYITGRGGVVALGSRFPVPRGRVREGDQGVRRAPCGSRAGADDIQKWMPSEDDTWAVVRGPTSKAKAEGLPSIWGPLFVAVCMHLRLHRIARFV